MGKRRKETFLFLISMVIFECNDDKAKNPEIIQNKSVDKNNNSRDTPRQAMNPVNPIISSEKLFYVPNQPASQVIIYDASESPSIKKSVINVYFMPTGLALSPDENTLYVSTTMTGNLTAYNAKTGEVTGFFKGGSLVAPRMMAVSSDGDRIYLVDALANKVKVFGTTDKTFLTSIDVGVSALYGVSVSSDNTLVAVTRRANIGGRVYVYSVDRDVNGNITGYTQKVALAAPGYPSYVLFGNESDRIFVRVHEVASPFRDAIIYSGPAFSDTASITLVDGDEKDPMGAFGETLALSSNGQYLYLTHYRTSKDPGESDSVLKKVHAYRISTVFYNDTTDNWYPRTDWKYNTDEYTYTDSGGKTFKVIYDGKMQNTLPPSMDGCAAVPDGSRVWFTSSQDGYHVFSKWTGFVDALGVLENPVPKAPKIIHPNINDNLTGYSGSASWDKPAGDTYAFVRYQIGYKEVGIDKWNILDENADYTSIVLTADKFVSGKTFIIRVRMYGSMNADGASGFWGSYTYSPQWKMQVAP